MDQNCEAMTRKCGAVVLFVGVECAPDRENWGVAQFAEAARFARSLGVDTLAPKRADGTILWPGSMQRLAEERAAVLGEGCGYLPFMYAYGPRFGDRQIADEAHMLAEMAAHNDAIIMVDMETEWNGFVSAAQDFNALMRPVPCELVVSTWADPREQAWTAVARALAPCVNAWAPQQYDNWLAAQEWQLPPLSETCIHPALDLSGEFGANDPVAIAREARARGHGTIQLWEYGFARANPAKAKAVIEAFKTGA